MCLTYKFILLLYIVLGIYEKGSNLSFLWQLEDEVELTEDSQPMLRSKRRLVLTTQLMQQLLCPAPKSILSANATSHHDSVIYFISRLALGDACSGTYCTRNDLLVSTDNTDM